MAGHHQPGQRTRPRQPAVPARRLAGGTHRTRPRARHLRRRHRAADRAVARPQGHAKHQRSAGPGPGPRPGRRAGARRRHHRARPAAASGAYACRHHGACRGCRCRCRRHVGRCSAHLGAAAPSVRFRTACAARLRPRSRLRTAVRVARRCGCARGRTTGRACRQARQRHDRLRHECAVGRPRLALWRRSEDRAARRRGRRSTWHQAVVGAGIPRHRRHRRRPHAGQGSDSRVLRRPARAR